MAHLRRRRLQIAVWNGRHGDALGFVRDPAANFSPDERSAWASALAALKGAAGPARARAAQRVEALTGAAPFDPVNVALLGALSEHGAAISAADRLIRAGGIKSARLLFEPNMAGAAHHPSFGPLVERLGLVRYWRDTGKLPDLCRKPGAPAFCRTLA